MSVSSHFQNILVVLTTSTNRRVTHYSDALCCCVLYEVSRPFLGRSDGYALEFHPQEFLYPIFPLHHPSDDAGIRTDA